MDFLLTLVTEWLSRKGSGLRVVLMSAAMDYDTISAYFRRLLGGEPPARLELEMPRPYPIVERYLEDFPYFVEQGVAHDWTRLHAADELASIIGGFILHLHDSRSKRPELCEGGAVAFGSFIMFLSGRRELELVAAVLDEAGRVDLAVKPLFGGQTIETQESLLRSSTPDARTVFLATDVIESSVTIPDVDVVIDTCEHKRFLWDTYRRQSSLALIRISIDEAKQRAGRAGRCRAGEVIRLMSRAEFKTLDEHVEAATLNSRLDSLVLTVFNWQALGNPRDFLLRMPQPPSQERVDAAIVLLNELSALVGGDADARPSPTSLGQLLTQMPMDAEAGALVLNGIRLGLALECVILAAVHERGDPFLSSRDWSPLQVHALYAARDACSPGRGFAGDQQDVYPSDLILGLRAYQAWKKVQKQHRFGPWPFEEEERWCTNHFLSLSRLHEIDVEVMEILYVLKKLALYAGDHDEEYRLLRARQRHMSNAQPRRSNLQWCGSTGNTSAGRELAELLKDAQSDDDILLLLWCLASAFIHGIIEIESGECGHQVVYKPKKGRAGEITRELQKQQFHVVRSTCSHAGVIVQFSDAKEAHRAVQMAALVTNRCFPWQHANVWRQPSRQTLTKAHRCYASGQVHCVIHSLSSPPPQTKVTVIAADVTPVVSHHRRSMTFLGSKCTIAPLGIFPFVLYATYSRSNFSLEKDQRVWSFKAKFRGMEEQLRYTAPAAQVRRRLDAVRDGWNREFTLDAEAWATRHAIVQERRHTVLNLMLSLSQLDGPPMVRV